MIINIKRVLSKIEYINVFYLFISLNPFLLWVIWPPIFTVSIFILSILSFFFLLSNDKIVVTRSRFLFSGVVLFFGLYLSLPIFRGDFDLGRLLNFFILSMLIFYDSQLLINIYTKMRKLFYFFCICSIVVFLLVLFKLEPPYYTIPGFSVVMQNLGTYYKLYGLVVSSTNTIYSFGGLNIMRICGPFLEPGHFGIYLGILSVFDKLIFKKVSIVFIITGLLTFSPGFLFFLGLILLVDIFIFKKIKGVLMYMSFVGILLLGLFSLNSDIRDELFYLTIGRNFSESSSDVLAVLDDRAGKHALRVYNDYLDSVDVYLGRGVSYLEDLGVLSDYRGIVFVYGYIGFILCLIVCLSLHKVVEKKELRIISLLIIALIISHRSWMLNSTFIYAIIFIGSLTYINKLENE